MLKASDLLRRGVDHLKDRAATRDTPDGERSMAATVAAFNAAFHKDLTEEQGWQFMTLLKMVRGNQGKFNRDDYEDGPAYFALAGEAAQYREGQPTPETEGTKVFEEQRCTYQPDTAIAVSYTTEDGGMLIDVPEDVHLTSSCMPDPGGLGPYIPTVGQRAFAIIFSDDTIWDCVNGWRE